MIDMQSGKTLKNHARKTSRKRTLEEALWKNEEKYKLLADHSADIIYKVDLESDRFTYASPSVERILGYTQDEVLRLKVSDIITAQSYAVQRKSLERALEVRGWDPEIMELEVVCRDGSILPVEIHVNFMLDDRGNPVEVLGVARDVSERKRMEKMLERRADFDRLVSRISSTFVKSAGNDIDMEIHRSLASIGAFIGADRAYVFLFHDDSGIADNTHEWCSGGIEAQIDNLKNIHVYEDLPWFGSHIRKGIPFQVSSVAGLPPEAKRERDHFEAQDIQSLLVIPMILGDRTFGFLGFDAVRNPRVWSDEDLSLLRFVGEILVNALDRLKLEQQTKQVAKAESLSRMAGAITHNFNNILSVILGNLELAMRDPNPKGDIADHLSEAYQASKRAAGITQQIMTYLGLSKAAHTPLDLSDACRQTLPGLRNKIKDTIALEFDFPCNGPLVIGNTAQIQQLLGKLVENAAESIETGRGTVHVSIGTVPSRSIPEKRFPVEFHPHNAAYALIEVKDTGRGIPEEDIEKIFDPFFSTKFMGRGLGLAMALGIVREHFGAITLESSGNGGCVFRVFLPVSET